jgi:hypothetical protein
MSCSKVTPIKINWIRINQKLERVVKIRQVLALAVMLGPVSAWAEVGDIHMVKVDSAVVREAPDKAATQVDKLSGGAEVMEMDVQGEWYEVYVASTDVGGWLHVSTLDLLGGGVPTPAPAAEQPAAAPTPAVAKAPTKTASAAPSSPTIRMKTQGTKSSGMKEFEKYLLRYNVRTNTIKGYIPFASAEDMGNGQLNLTVTNQWLEKSKARQKSSLITLFTRWKKANNTNDVQINAVDASGNKVAQYPK